MVFQLSVVFEQTFGRELSIIGVVIPQIHSHSILRYHSSPRCYLPTLFFWLRGLACSHLFPILLLEKVSPRKLWNHAKRAGSKERRVTVRMLADLAFGLLAERFSIPKKGSRRKFFRGDGCPPLFFLLCANNISGEKVRGWC